MVTTKEKPLQNSLASYDEDYYLWFNQQADLLRSGQLSVADLENIAEELEDMGKKERRTLISSYRLILVHLLKWHYQPKRRTRSWRVTIARERLNAFNLESDSPSLRDKISEILAKSYTDAAREASAETDLPLDTFPAACPWTLDQIRDPDFLPQ